MVVLVVASNAKIVHPGAKIVNPQAPGAPL
jgi:hypothetical protein